MPAQQLEHDMRLCAHPQEDPARPPLLRALHKVWECQLQPLRLRLPHMIQPASGGGSGGSGDNGRRQAVSSMLVQAALRCPATHHPVGHRHSPSIHILNIVVFKEAVALCIRAQDAQLLLPAYGCRLQASRAAGMCGGWASALLGCIGSLLEWLIVRAQLHQLRPTCPQVASPAAGSSISPPGPWPAARPAAAPAGAPTACSGQCRRSAGCPAAHSPPSRKPAARRSGGGGRPRAPRAPHPCKVEREGWDGEEPCWSSGCCRQRQ